MKEEMLQSLLRFAVEQGAKLALEKFGKEVTDQTLREVLDKVWPTIQEKIVAIDGLTFKVVD